MIKRFPALFLALIITLSLTAPASAAKIDVSGMPGHEMLSLLPATLQRPAYPATVRQTDPLMTRFTDFDHKEETWPYEQSLESVFQEMVSLTDSLTAGKTTDTQKVKAIFEWVSQNVKYGILIDGIDEEGYLSKVDAYADPLQVYIRRHARCEGYALMCQFMCTIAGIPTAYIAGKAQGSGILHAWNAALADGGWIFFDATWREWDMAPNYHSSTDQLAYYDGVFLIQAFPKGVSSGYDVRLRLRTGFSCPNSVTVPDRVTWVDLKNCPGLTDITLPDSVTEVYLTGCTGLTNVTLPGRMTSIEGGAFNGCTNLKNVNIPNGVTTIGNSAFMGCTSLKSITIPNSVTTLENLAFAQSGLTSVTVPGSVTSMEAVFYECTGLESVKLERGVTAIGHSAFTGCTSLKDVAIPDTVKTIEDQAFWNCTSLESVTIPDGVTTIGKMAFYGCTSLKQADLPDSVTDLDPSAFLQCPNLQQGTTLPAGLTAIPAYMFRDRTDLTSFVIPDSVTEIGYQSFQRCTNLKSVTIPNSVTNIENYAFADCSSLTSITIPAGVTRIGYNAFYNCRGLKSVVIPDSVTALDKGAFSCCSGLTGVTISSSITSLEDFVFSNCSGLTSITIPESVTSIGRSFNGCTGLKSIVIPNRVTSIGNFAFDGCTGLESVTIPKSVTSIDMWAFADCPSLTDIYYGGTEAQWKAIKISKDRNDALFSATIHYNSAAPDATTTPFSDVAAGKWYTDAVTWANERNITNGTGNGKFSPAQQCTHAQILTFLYRAARNQGTAEPADMDKAVAWAREKGMIGAGFNPKAPCTRADAVNYIWQALGKESAKAGGFTDVPANASYAKAVDWAVANGVTNGTNDAQTEFSPNRVCDRGTIVTFLHRAYVPSARLPV